MKKKSFAFLAGIVFLAAILVSFFFPDSEGDTTEKRERMLRSAISENCHWTIVKELELDGYIISAAYSTNHKATLAVFRPMGEGNYQFSFSENRNEEEIIIGGAVIDGKWYDLIWFHGAKTEYAHITYTINGQKQASLRYDTSDMDIICHEKPQKEYAIQVVYYDSEGNRYE